MPSTKKTHPSRMSRTRRLLHALLVRESSKELALSSGVASAMTLIQRLAGAHRVSVSFLDAVDVGLSQNGGTFKMGGSPFGALEETPTRVQKRTPAQTGASTLGELTTELKCALNSKSGNRLKVRRGQKSPSHGGHKRDLKVTWTQVYTSDREW